TATGNAPTATATGLNTATSSSFNITAGVATQLAFGTEPGTTVANRQITPAVKVRALDAFGNVATGFTGAVAVALGSNPGSATLSGTTPVAAVAGVATFVDLSVNKTGTGYTLTGSASGFAPVTSTAFDITPGTATQLAFTQQPSTTVAGATISPAVQVTALDPAGNPVTSFTGSVTVALGNNLGGSTLSGTTTTAAVGGVATFVDLRLDKTGTGYWLTATATGLNATSSGFNITPGAATQLVFGTQPGTTVAGQQITPAVKLRALDALGNVATGFTGAITVALGSNPGGATLSGTLLVAAVGGVASFGDLSLNRTATGYTLTASGGGLGPVTSTSFNITAGTATQLVFGTQPGTITGGKSFSPAVKVRALDGLGNLATAFTGEVTVTLNSPGSGTLSGTTTVAAAGGVATFFSLSVNVAASGYTLTAAAAGLPNVESVAFDVIVGPASHLDFQTHPHDEIAGRILGSPYIQLRAEDTGGNLVTSFTGLVTVAIAAN